MWWWLAGCLPEREAVERDPLGHVDDTSTVEDPNGPDPGDLPAYSGGTCPTLTPGTSSFGTSGGTRQVRIVAPPDPEGKPLVFLFHWLGGDPDEIVSAMGWSTFDGADDAIFVAPDGDDPTFEWRFLAAPEGNEDLVLFDDLLRCAWETWQVDLDRVYATGMSAGGLWTSYLLQHRSEHLAAAAPLSGGATPANYSTPSDDIPVLLIWGGETDTYGTFDFHEAALTMSEALRADGHPVIECNHGQGHTVPPQGRDLVWSFFGDHPRPLGPSPWVETGLQAGTPSWCSVP